MTARIDRTGPAGVTVTAMRYEAFAPLLAYPSDDWDSRLGAARAALHEAGLSDAGHHLDRFAKAMVARTSASREELHAATFDMSRQCVPYVTIHLFGEENFKRGAFMAALNARFAAIDFSTGGELPDHLAVLLRFLGEAADEDERHELVEHVLFGPVGRMMASLPETNPYRDLVGAIQATLQELHPGPAAAAELAAAARPVGSCSPAGGACGCPAPGGKDLRRA